MLYAAAVKNRCSANCGVPIETRWHFKRALIIAGRQWQRFCFRCLYPPKESNRDRLCGIIDTILAEKPGDYETFLQKLEQQGYEVKRGKYTAVKGKGRKRFIRFRTLGIGYGEEEIKAVLEGRAAILDRFYGRVSENQSVINAARASLPTSCDIVPAHLSA